ncbi:hypothetical protein NDU88_006454, partial [Pleurodeles waltl]
VPCCCLLYHLPQHQLLLQAVVQLQDWHHTVDGWYILLLSCSAPCCQPSKPLNLDTRGHPSSSNQALYHPSF